MHASQRIWTAALLLSALVISSGAALAQEKKSAFSSADEAARQSSNPLGGDFFIFLNQIDNYFLAGDITDDNQNLNVWAMQPVIPIPLTDLIGEDWIFVTRPTLPFIMNSEQPDFPPPGNFRDKSGFGDLTWFSFLGKSVHTDAAGGGDIVVGLGPTFQFPTASSTFLGAGKYAAGPSAVGAFIGTEFILGGLLQHWEAFDGGGQGTNDDLSFSWLNLFYFINLNDGWQVGGTPVITVDWEADSKNDRYTVPIGLGVYKTSFFGKMPIKMGIEAQWMPIRPHTFGQEFNIRFVFAPIIPSPFGSLAK